MDDNYVTLATEKIPNRNVLINVAATRAKELAQGSYPMVPVDRTQGVNYLDVALREIAEGKIFYESPEEV